MKAAAILLAVFSVWFADAGTLAAAPAQNGETVRALVDGEPLELFVPEGYNVLPKSHPLAEVVAKAMREQADQVVIPIVFCDKAAARALSGEDIPQSMRFVVPIIGRESWVLGTSRAEFEASKADLRKGVEGVFAQGIRDSLGTRAAAMEFTGGGVSAETETFAVASYRLADAKNGLTVGITCLALALDGRETRMIFYALGTVPPEADIAAEAAHYAQRYEKAGRLYFAPEPKLFGVFPGGVPLLVLILVACGVGAVLLFFVRRLLRRKG